MALTLVTDTDVAAIPYDLAMPATFRLDPKNKGPFAAMLPLSDILDDSKEASCKKQIANQLQHIPADLIREMYLRNKGLTTAVMSIDAAGNQAQQEAFARKLFTEAMKEPPSKGYELFAEQIKQNSIFQKIDTPDDYLASHQKMHGGPENTVATRALQLLTFSNQPLLGATRQLHEKWLQSDEYKQLMQETETQIIGKITSALGPKSEPVFRHAMSINDRQERFDAYHTALKELMQDASPSQKVALLTEIQGFQKTYNIRPSFKTLLAEAARMASNVFGPKNMEYDLGQAVAAQTFASDPHAMAESIYEAMRQQAREQRAKPENPIRAYQADIEHILSSCPEHIKNAANERQMKVVIVDDKTEINRIIPNDAGFIFGGSMAGGSTGQGIYVKRDMLRHPATLKEEMIHEIEREIVPTNKGYSESFSLQPAWQKAIALDSEAITQNPAAKFLLREPIKCDATHHKLNAALGPNKRPLKLPESDSRADEHIPFVEAVPDLYHLAQRAQEAFGSKASLRVGGRMGFGGTKYDSPDALMRDAFPNAWRMLEGPQKGNQLVQSDDGRVSEVPAGDKPGPQVERVSSLREYCENPMHRKQGAGNTLSTTSTNLKNILFAPPESANRPAPSVRC